MQVEEIAEVLDETDRQIALVQTLAQPRVVSRPTGSAVRLRVGIFHTDTTAGTDRPIVFAGFGHFDAVQRDLPLFEKIGVTAIQDGRGVEYRIVSREADHDTLVP